MAYDAGCGPCTTFKTIVDILDRYNRIDFLSLTEAEKLGFLNTIPQYLRFQSFHLISPDQGVVSGADALLYLIALFPLGSLVSKLIKLLPGGKIMINFLYGEFSKLQKSCSSKVKYNKAKEKRT